MSKYVWYGCRAEALPIRLGPAPLPIIAVLLGATSGRTVFTFFKRTVEAASLLRCHE
jgi:hypothetical protein